MKKLSQSLLADIVSTKRKAKNMTQQELSDKVGINRALLSRLEQQDFMPSIPQLENLAEVLDFEPSDLFINSEIKNEVTVAAQHCRCGNGLRRPFHRHAACTAQPCHSR